MTYSFAGDRMRLLQARARRRMACIPHSQDLLTRLLAPLAADRIAVDDVVVHPMFRSLQLGSEL